MLWGLLGAAGGGAGGGPGLALPFELVVVV